MAYMYSPPSVRARSGKPASEVEIYSVSRLNAEARFVIESGFPAFLWVEGELSNFSAPSSGHWYFSLKDQAAQVRCAMFRPKNFNVGFRPENGMHVLVRTRVSLYEGRGDFQLIIEEMEEAGDGALRRAFEQLKNKLAAEGLFDSERKKPLPPFTRSLGVITSPTGAAIRDILSVVQRRFPSLPVIIYPTAVQGEDAPRQIVAALATAQRRNECDVLIVARGGGSLEDLWAFNDESVARAIAACTLPVVCGVGHEIDVTIADLVADQRAPTPSAAAELVTPDQRVFARQLDNLFSRLTQRWRHVLTHQQQRLQWLEKRLAQQHPTQRLRQHSQRLDELEQRLKRAQTAYLRQQRTYFAALAGRLYRTTPDQRLAQLATTRQQLSQRLTQAMRVLLTEKRHRVGNLSRALDAVSPLATLARGFAVVKDMQTGKVLRNAADVRPGEQVTAQLHRGVLECEVKKVNDET